MEPNKTAKYDKVIISGKILDDTGYPWYYGDIAIKNDEIVKVGGFKHSTATDTINAKGLYVTRGFIDTSMDGRASFMGFTSI